MLFLQVGRTGFASGLVFLACLLGWCHYSFAAGPIDFDALQDVAPLLEVTYQGTTFNRRTLEQSTNVILSNTSDQDVSCPLVLVLSGLTGGVTLTNAEKDPTPAGDPYVDLSDQVADGVLAAGESSEPFRLIFSNPARRRFTFDEACLGVIVLGELSVTIDAPVRGTVTQAATTAVSGAQVEATSVTVNGMPAALGAGTYSVAGVPLVEGTNVLVATAQDADGNTASASVSIRRDNSPPLVVIESPRNGDRLVSDSVPVAGTVNDIIPGATVNQDDVSVTINGLPAPVNNRTFFLADLPLAPGANTITATAVDRAGNTATTSIQVSREPDLAGIQISITGGNGQQGPINSTLPDQFAVRLSKGGSPEAARPVTFSVSRGDGLLGNVQQNLRSVTLLTDGNGAAQLPFTLGGRTGQGFHRVRVTTPGSLAFAEFCGTALTSPPANIAVVMAPPVQSVASKPLPDPVAAIVTDQGGNPVAAVPVTFQIDNGGGNFDGSPSKTVPTNADGIAEATWTLGPAPGVANNECSASFDGNPGLPATYIVSGIVTGPVAQTTVSGIVQNSAGAPIVGAKAVIRGTSLEAFTGSDGKFLIADVPPGGHHVGVLGSAANNPGQGIFYPNIEYAIQVIAGVQNRLDQIVILPFLDQGGAKLVGGDEDVTLTMQGVPGFSVTVLAHSTFLRDPITGALVQTALEMSSSQVKNDKVPMAPPQGSTPLIVGTLQPGGVLFNPPARVCYPNAEGLAPGDVADVFAFHHDIGQFVNIGPGTVTEDGSQVCSDPGFGIVQSGWHCLIRLPGPAANCANDCTAQLKWQLLDSSGNPTGTVHNNGPVVVCTGSKARVEVTFAPGGGSFDSTAWTGGSPQVNRSSESTSGTKAVVIVEGGQTGNTTITSPLYRIPVQDKPDKTCQAEVEVEVNRIDSVEWIQVAGPLDNNPKAGGGKRIFPGKATPAGAVQNKVKVRATLTPMMAGIDVYFKAFDVDDPSANTAPLDDESNASDNRGALNQIAAAAVPTDANGVAEVEFTVSMNPSDNFKVVASCDQAFLTGLTAKQNDGTSARVVDGANTPVPANQITEMLTVWRKLHVEMDSMTAVANNDFSGAFTDIVGTGTALTEVRGLAGLGDASKDLDDAPAKNGRFEKGTLVVGTAPNTISITPLTGNGNSRVVFANASIAGLPFAAVDNDLFLNGTMSGTITQVSKSGANFVWTLNITANNENPIDWPDFVGGTLSVGGGANVSIVAVNQGANQLTTSGLNIPAVVRDDDTATLPTTIPIAGFVANAYADAYIDAVKDGGGNAANNKNNVPFIRNIAFTNAALKVAMNQANGIESDGNRSDGYWVAYVLFGFQSAENLDYDPDGESSSTGQTPSDAAELGSVIFPEHIVDIDRHLNLPQSVDVHTKNSVAHEMGHQFDLGHANGMIMGPMGNGATSFHPIDQNILRQRVTSPGK